MWCWIFLPWGMILGVPIALLFILPCQALGLIRQHDTPHPCVIGYRVKFPDSWIGGLWYKAWRGWGGLALPFLP